MTSLCAIGCPWYTYVQAEFQRSTHMSRLLSLGHVYTAVHTCPAPVDIEDVADNLDCDELEIYPNSSKHNKCLIINNAFTGQKNERHGTQKDEENLKRLFTELGYKVIVEKELGNMEMLTSLQGFLNDDEQKHASSTVVFVLSHGSVHGLHGVNGGVISTHTFLTCLNSTNAPLLAGKPKLVFLQACRGEERDSGEIVETDSPEKLILPVESDILVCYSTPPYYVSYRNPINGSWFVQEFCTVLDKHARSHDINTLLTCVNNRVSKRVAMCPESNQITSQISEFNSRLRKLFYFFPGALTTTYNDRKLKMWFKEEQVNQNVAMKCNEGWPRYEMTFYWDGSAVALRVSADSATYFIHYFVHCPYSTNLYRKAHYRGSPLFFCNLVLIPNTTILAYKNLNSKKVEFLDVCHPDAPFNPIVYDGSLFDVKASNSNILALQVDIHKLLIYRVDSGERKHELIHKIVRNAYFAWTLASNGVLAYWDRSGTAIKVYDVNDCDIKIEIVTPRRLKFGADIHLGRNGTVLAVTSSRINFFELYDVRNNRLIFYSVVDDWGPFRSMCTSEDDRLILLETRRTMIVHSLRKAENGGVPSVQHRWTLRKDRVGCSAFPRLRQINGIPHIQFQTKTDVLKLYKFDEADNSWNLL